MLNADVQRAIERMSEQAQQLTGRLQDMTATGTDDQELVRATCGAGGHLIDIEFEALSRRLHTHELRDAVLQAVQRASAAAQQSITDALTEFTGSANPLGSDVVGQAHQHIEQYQRLVDEQRQKLEGMRGGSH